jgi:hypothetical protein
LGIEANASYTRQLLSHSAAPALQFLSLLTEPQPPLPGPSARMTYRLLSLAQTFPLRPGCSKLLSWWDFWRGSTPNSVGSSVTTYPLPTLPIATV